jgi:peptidyl-tRNA hydrolase
MEKLIFCSFSAVKTDAAHEYADEHQPESEMKFIFKVKSKKEVYLLNVFIQSNAIVKGHCASIEPGLSF